MRSFNKWAQTYAKMFGVIAAVIIFGAWLMQNIIVERVKKFRDSISQAEENKKTTERFFRLESKMLEVYQVASSARKYSAEARSRERWTFLDDLYLDIEQLERTGVTREYAYSFEAYAGRTDDILSTIKPPDNIADRVKTATSKLHDIRTELDKQRERYRREQMPIAGEVINPNTITKEQAEKLRPIIRNYRNEVEFNIAPQLTSAANELFRAYDELFSYAHTELKKRERRLKLVRGVQISLYIFGSIIAIYGSYLQATRKNT